MNREAIEALDKWVSRIASCAIKMGSVSYEYIEELRDQFRQAAGLEEPHSKGVKVAATPGGDKPEVVEAKHPLPSFEEVWEKSPMRITLGDYSIVCRDFYNDFVERFG